MNPILQVEDLSKVFLREGRPDFYAVDHVSFSVMPGEIIGLVGESGSGKSTIAKLITRLIDATTGSITVDGQDITHLKGKDLIPVYEKIQMVFQNPVGSFDPRRTLGDGIGESLRNKGVPKAEIDARCRELLAHCGLPGDFVKRYPFDTELPDSIISNLNRAYDNAIVLRESIGSESLAFIQLAIYAMNKAANSKAPLIELQKVSDFLLSFYGIADDQIDSENVRNIIKAGKRIERIDIYARLGMGKKELAREVHRMAPRVRKSGLDYNKEKLESVERLIEEEELDYYKIVSEVESIF